MMSGSFALSRRSFVAMIGLFHFFGKRANAAEKLTAAPCSFPFDASRKGSIINEKFKIKTYRHYIFTLEFHHTGGDDAKRLSDLIDPRYVLVTRESLNDENPVVVTYDYLAQHGGGTLTERTQRMAYGEQDGTYVRKPRNLRGMIPIHIAISRIDEAGNAALISDTTVETLGFFAGGNGRFVRQITVEALRPGTYQFQAETVVDSPLFHDREIQLGVTFYPKESPLKE